MSGLNPESGTAKIADYVGFAYLTQLAFQSGVNALARRDLQNAIASKCGAAGASNYAELEKELLSSNPLTARLPILGRFSPFNRIPVSAGSTVNIPQWRGGFISPKLVLGTTAAVMAGGYLLDSDQKWPLSAIAYFGGGALSKSPLPMFPGINNPFLLNLFAAGNVEDYFIQVDAANKIENPEERQKALAKIDKSGLYFAAAETAGAFFLADYNRGFAVTSRLPGISRFAPLGERSAYRQSLESVSDKIQCNDNSGPGGGDTSEEAAKGATATATSSLSADPAAGTVTAAPVTDPTASPTSPMMSIDPDTSAQAVAYQMCSLDFISEEVNASTVIPEAILVPLNGASLAQVSLAMFGKVQGNPVSSASPVQGIQVYHANNPVIVAPSTLTYTTAPLVQAVRPITSVLTNARPLFVLEPAAIAE